MNQKGPLNFHVSLLCFFLLFLNLFPQRHLEQMLWSSIFPRGPIRFSVPQFPIRCFHQGSSPQDWIFKLLPPLPLPMLHLDLLRCGETWTVFTGCLCSPSVNHVLDLWCFHSSPQDWPQAMKEYVQRCFTACETEEDKDRTEKVLKEVLQDRLKDGSAYTIDWTREPLPEWVLKWINICLVYNNWYPRSFQMH